MQYRVKISQEPDIYKVRVTSPPKAKTGYQVDGSLANDISSFGGANLKLSSKDAVQTKTITKVPREEANLEAEGGETVLTFDPSGYPLFYEIKGPRHSNNGVPLNLPDDSFIYSDTKSMMIKDPQILKMFNKPIKKGGYTPADLSKQFLTLNKYRGILQDSTSDKIAVQTAQLMIKKAVSKLGALALAQESKKGFPQGIPVVAKAYMEENNISEADVLPDAQKEESAPQQGMEGAPQGQAPQGQGAQPTMPDGSPVAMPEETAQEMPQPGMQQPGMRRGGFLPQAKKGLEQVLSEITDKVRSAMENGIPMTEIIISLIQNQVSVDDIKKVLMNLNIPDRQAQEFVLEALSQYQQNAQQQQQQMAAQQQGMMQGQPGGMQQPPQQQMDPRMAQMMAAQMQGGQGQPQMDPRQQQQAQPSEEEMMAMQQQQMQQAPMAAYGMQMGGYDMPFDQYAYGGYYRNGGYLHTAGNGEEVKGKKGNVSASKVDKIGTDYTSTKTLSGKTAGYKLTEGEKRANAKGAISGGGAPSSGWEGAICDMIKKGATYEELTDPDVAFKVTGIRKTHMAPGASSKAIFDRCNVNAAKFEDKEEAVFIDGEPVKECPPCIDPVTGVAMVDANGATIVRTKDPATGECSACPENPEEECFCTDPYSNEETIVPCGTDCHSWEQEKEGESNFTQIQNLPEDEFELAVAMGARNVNEAPIMGKAPGVREDAWGTDYMGQAELLKGQTRSTQDAIRKVSGNNPGGTMAALFNAEAAGQNNIINLASQTNAANANIATGLRKANVAHQWDQLLLGKQAQDTYNPQHATWASNVAQDNNNQWANIANKYGKMKGNARTIAATNAAQGMKWGIDAQGNEGYYNTNNTPITPTAPTKTVLDQMSDYKSAGITSDADALRAIDLQMRMNKKSRMGGHVFAEGGFLLGDTVYPFKLR